MAARDAAESTRKITEKSEKARRDFFKKVEKITKDNSSSGKLMQTAVEQGALEYGKVFGRIGVHPLISFKGGKQLPRYILDRDEVWMIYKPPLWQMGGKEEPWMRAVMRLVGKTNDIYGAEQALLDSDKMECLQEWHGLRQGLKWLDPKMPPKQWGFIQRLDVETDGPIIVAKTWRAQRCLSAQMNEHVLGKAYMCLVHGRLENRIQFVKCKFAELGSDAATQVMLKYDPENDPFYQWTESGRLPGRSKRTAETFVKPIAYYHRKEDNSDYTLVYVNILTGITHQIRITMQSLGHPIVADDRYLPKDQATLDLKWCPRNFLVEVRSDWFDLCGPHKDEPRRRYTRISVENPLPALFQKILTKVLTLTEQLDLTADLFVGCQYWAIGDEQLMSAYPKDAEYRKKVIRWGQRQGIHLDALDRLLLLPKEDIDEILNNYRPPADKDEASWICPKCMTLNMPKRAPNDRYSGTSCIGNPQDRGDDQCTGERVVPENAVVLPPGWLNFIADPTIHFIFLINAAWLQARRKILRSSRPLWEKPPLEAEGTMATESMLAGLEAALVLKVKEGVHFLHESELQSVPGLQDIKLPLALPAASRVYRCRLPGCGTHSQWVYALAAEARLTDTANFTCKTKRLLAPVAVKADPLPAKQILTRSEMDRQKKQQERQEAEKTAEKTAEVPPASVAPIRWEEQTFVDIPVDEPPPKKAKSKGEWKRLESSRRPGSFYYFNSVTGESSELPPPDAEEVKPVWERLPSKSNPGQYYYYNNETGESRVDRPLGVEIINEKVEPQIQKKEPEEAVKAPVMVPWVRQESSSKPGQFYYFNPATGANEVFPPEVDPPWKVLESKQRKGQYYYFNEVTGETTVDPPAGARPAKGPPVDLAANAGSKRPAPEGSEEVNKRVAKASVSASGDMPPNWEKKSSDKFPGKFYYVNTVTGETTWEKPAPSDWERQESKSNPGSFYYVNRLTGETTWDKQVANSRQP